MMFKYLKNEKGITLIALIVTIIILIILVSSSLLLLFKNDGIIYRAKVAKRQKELADEKDTLSLCIADSIDESGSFKIAILETKIPRNWSCDVNTGIVITKLGQQFFVDSEGYHNAYKFTLKADPNDANIEINVNGKVISKTGENSVFVTEGATINVKVEKEDYITATKEYSIQNENLEDTINLEKQKFKFTITSNPNDALIKLTYDGKEVSNKGTNEIEVTRSTIINWLVKEDYYEEQSGNYTMEKENYSQNITLNAKAEQTITVSPSSVTTSGSISDVNNAKNNNNNNSYALSNDSNSALTWNFNGLNEIADDAKILNLSAHYKIANTVAYQTAIITLQSGNTTYVSRTDNNVGLNGVTYEVSSSDSELLNSKDIKSSLKLTVNKKSGKAVWMRWYGATATIKYVNP